MSTIEAEKDPRKRKWILLKIRRNAAFAAVAAFAAFAAAAAAWKEVFR